MLFANETLTQTADTAGFLPPHWAGNLAVALLVSTIFFVLALFYMGIGYRVIDWITPGNLCGQLLGTTTDKNGTVVRHTPDGNPNLALGVVAGAMFLGLCIVIAAAIH